MKYCTKCEKMNNDNAKFCYNCGNQFSSALITEENNNGFSGEEQGSPYYKVEHSDIKIKTPDNQSTLNKVSLILGIISISLLGIICFPISIIVSPIAIITGIVAIIRNPKQNKKKAKLGIIFGGIALILSIILFIIAPIYMELQKNKAYEICEQYPYSEECQEYKEQYPGWFK